MHLWLAHCFGSLLDVQKANSSVLHSGAESEIISLDAGLRMDGLPALQVWALGML